MNAWYNVHFSLNGFVKIIGANDTYSAKAKAENILTSNIPEIEAILKTNINVEIDDVFYDEEVSEKPGVEITEDSVTIRNEQGKEIVHWIEDEWKEDPSVTLAIANAITMFYNQGPKAVLDCIYKNNNTLIEPITNDITNAIIAILNYHSDEHEQYKNDFDKWLKAAPASIANFVSYASLKGLCSRAGDIDTKDGLEMVQCILGIEGRNGGPFEYILPHPACTEIIVNEKEVDIGLFTYVEIKADPLDAKNKVLIKLMTLETWSNTYNMDDFGDIYTIIDILAKISKEATLIKDMCKYNQITMIKTTDSDPTT